jgi:hypothetical protein
MPASKSEQVLDALKALLETVPQAVVERNSVLPEKVPSGGLTNRTRRRSKRAGAGTRRLREHVLPARSRDRSLPREGRSGSA